MKRDIGERQLASRCCSGVYFRARSPLTDAMITLIPSVRYSLLPTDDLSQFDLDQRLDEQCSRTLSRSPQMEPATTVF